MKAHLFALVLLLVLLTGPRLTPQRPAHADLGEADTLAQQVVELTNAERATQGLPPLKLQNNLRDAAMWMAQDLGAYSYFNHTDRLGRFIDVRLPAFGYTSYSTLGENIAAGFTTPAAVVAAWMTSAGHRANILNGNFREIGVGYAYQSGSTYGRYWVQDFGSRFDVYPIVVNGEAARTSSPGVTVYLYGSGWAQQMRLSNDGLTWTPWESYQVNRSWTLGAGSGMRTVYLELRNGTTTRSANDSIELVAPPSTVPTAALSYRAFLPLAVKNR